MPAENIPLPPRFIFPFVMWFINMCWYLLGKILPPPMRIMSISTGFMNSMALYCVTKLRIADALMDGPKSTEELAAATGVKTDHLFRILRSLESVGIFKRAQDLWANNNHSLWLRPSNEPCSLYSIITVFGHESYLAHTKMLDAMQQGEEKLAFELYWGTDIWDYFDKNEQVGAQFNDAMVQFSKLNAPSILDDFDWSRFSHATVIDVGGGTGGLLAALLKRHPNMKGILFDRQSAITDAEELWKTQYPLGMVERTEFAVGDFLESVPPADVYLMKHILHDWCDSKCIQILKSTKASMASVPSAKLLIIEQVMPEKQPVGPMAAALDLEMMMVVGGKERTSREWQELLTAGGFMLKRIHKIRSPYCIIEALPSVAIQEEPAT